MTPFTKDKALELVEKAKALAFAGDFSPDDLGGDVGTMTFRNPDGPALLAIVEEQAQLISSLIEENAELRKSVTAFAGPWAVSWAEMVGLPNGHIHPKHYDLLERCGARMDDFTRADLPSPPSHG